MWTIEKGFWHAVIKVFAVGLAVFHLYTGIFGLFPAQEQRAVHVGLALSLVYFTRPARRGTEKKAITWVDLLCIATVLLATSNIYVKWMKYMPIMEDPATPLEWFLALASILVILESGRRAIGWVFPILTLITIVYALWGHFIPGKFGHAPIRWQVVVTQIYFSTQGIWGFMTGLSSTYIALFIFFGAVLLATGGGKTFIDLSLLGAGQFRGGPAKVAVLASAFFSMLSGSSIANVATTGNFTIPMMKRLGYSSEFAAGVESTASTGGIVTPPIMGAAAFVMAEFLGVAYLKVIVAAAIPAFLFYLAVFMGVHFEALRRDLQPIPPEDLPPLKSVLTGPRMLGLILPISVLLYTLLTGYSLIMVGTSASVVSLLTYIFSDPSTKGMKERLGSLIGVFESAGRSIIAVVPVMVSANIVLCLLNYTGLGLKISSFIIGLGKANLILSIFMTGILVMILGTELPITAAYILGVAVAAPLLIQWGILPIAAHLFILYYSMLATITPPVCPTVYVGSHIAKANWLKTAWVAMRLAPLLYLMPFLFIFDSTFLMIGTAKTILLNVSTATLGAIVLASGSMGQLLIRCAIPMRLILVVSGVLLLFPGWRSDALGFSLFLIIFTLQWRQRTTPAFSRASIRP
jgi:TRAP transporter 4TM/12TM fusion protein